LGPVYTADATNGAVVVAGQTFAVDSWNGVAPGSYVLVGVVEGFRAEMFYITEQYVPGVSVIHIKGVITELDSSRGIASVGQAMVDYTALLAANPNLTLSIGAKVSFFGTQPTPGGVLIATPLNDQAVVVVSSNGLNYQQGGPFGDLSTGERKDSH
jgi:hypothetical protein